MKLYTPVWKRMSAVKEMPLNTAHHIQGKIGTPNMVAWKINNDIIISGGVAIVTSLVTEGVVTTSHVPGGVTLCQDVRYCSGVLICVVRGVTYPVVKGCVLP